MRNTWPRVPSEIVTTATVKATMFSNLTSILTMTAMLLHSIFGCCAHHAHACEHGRSAEECHAEHVEQHSEVAEIAQTGHLDASHQSQGHADCSSHGDDGNHGCRDAAGGKQIAADEERDSSPHPQGPCQQKCDGGGCSFTQSAEVKPPSPNEGRLGFPASAAVLADVADLGHVSTFRTDSGPPGKLVAICSRPMLQVWRL